MNVTDEIIIQGLLYDFYGELLTKHQKRIYEEVVLNDYSVSEVAKDEGISRQGVHDMVKRCEKILSSYEEKLGLVKKFRETKKLVSEIKILTGEFQINYDPEIIKKIEKLSQEIMDI